MEIRTPFQLPVLGPQVDFKFWEQVFAAGQGPVTGIPAESMAIMLMRQVPSPFVIANGRLSDPVTANPASVLPGR